MGRGANVRMARRPPCKQGRWRFAAGIWPANAALNMLLYAQAIVVAVMSQQNVGGPPNVGLPLRRGLERPKAEVLGYMDLHAL